MKHDKDKLKLAEPADLDHMPIAVATAFLTEPKARITNRHRKLCKQAREKVFLSTSPIVRVRANAEIDEFAFHYTGIEPKTVEHKLVAKAKRATLKQLDKWRGRCGTRRAQVQSQYQKLTEEPITEPNAAFKQKLQQRALELLSLRAALLDLAWDIFDTEISERAARCSGKPPINPSTIRRTALAAAVALEQLPYVCQ